MPSITLYVAGRGTGNRGQIPIIMVRLDWTPHTHQPGGNRGQIPIIMVRLH